MLLPGDPAPDFTADSNVNPTFKFNTVAGRYSILCFFGSSQHPFAASLLAEGYRMRDRFDGSNLMFFGVSVDPSDRGRLRIDHPGIVFFWDTDAAISDLYGAGKIHEARAAKADLPGTQRTISYRPHTLVLDQGLRVVAVIPHEGDPSAHLTAVFRAVDSLPKLEDLAFPAPAIVVPNIFERDFCKNLIDYYLEHGGKDSGFMVDVDGKTVGNYDYARKRRADCEIIDATLVQGAQHRMVRRLVPAIKQAFQFDATRIERHIVACYDAATGGHFKAHRDNTARATSHRRFAVTLNLNAEDFEGCELWFPEYSRQRYRAPTGGAVVFSCSILHEATPVTEGTRYAFLPFLYDDAAAKIREHNRIALGATTAPPAT